MSGSIKWDPLLHQIFVGKLVHVPDELAGMEIINRIPFFELVNLFQNRHGDCHIMLFEVEYGIKVVKDNRGIQYKDFLLLFWHKPTPFIDVTFEK
jgi:hypothetical protein